MRKYKWGILAPGSIARRFAAGLKLAPEAERYAVGSRDLARAKAFADEFGFQKSYGSYEELARDPDIDIVYVASQHPQHAEYTILCLENGKNVVCEKPVAVNAKQTVRMIECARKNNVFLMEGMWTRFFPSVIKTRELIAEGAIGKVRHLNADFCFRASPNPESRLFNPEAAGGSLLDVGIYNISFASMVYGKQPDRIDCPMYIGETGVDEMAPVILSYEGGQSAFCFSAVNVSTPQDAVIYGEEGWIKLPGYWHGDTVQLFSNGELKELKFPFEQPGFQFEAMEVMSCLDKGWKESPSMTLDESLVIMETMDKIRAANHLRYPFESEDEFI
jgi:predicted dehydrogenase